jgi:hypothetical protein
LKKNQHLILVNSTAKMEGVNKQAVDHGFSRYSM